MMALAAMSAFDFRPLPTSGANGRFEPEWGERHEGFDFVDPDD
jgi:hypothetical protein